MAEPTPQARSAFARLLEPAGDAAAPGVRVRERPDLTLATVLARKGQGEALRGAIARRYGVEAPLRPAIAAAGDVAFAATGPGAWLFVREGRDPAHVGELTERLAGIAAVSDQTGGLGVLRLSGKGARATLAKGIHIDLDAGVFPVGAAAVTDCAHVGVTLWRAPDRAADEPVFDLVVARSLAGSFWSWLAASAAEFGLAVER